MSLKSKAAIVTGGNSGIGQAIVLELARQGANVVIDYVCHPDATEALGMVGFLAGEGASYLAATTIFADGGIMHSSVGL